MGDDDADQTPPSAEPEKASIDLRWWNETYETTATSAEVVTGYADSGPCIVIDRDQVRRVKNGTITLTWEGDATPHAPELALLRPEEETLRTAGTPPLVLEVMDLEVRDQMRIGAYLEDGQAFVNLPITLTWTFHYEGAAEPMYLTGNC